MNGPQPSLKDITTYVHSLLQVSSFGWPGFATFIFNGIWVADTPSVIPHHWYGM